jgi:hypothetical protein
MRKANKKSDDTIEEIVNLQKIKGKPFSLVIEKNSLL